MHSKLLLISLLLWLSIPATAQEPFLLTAASLQNGQAVELDKLGWKYSPNDDPRFADPQFDDRAWETLNGTAITLDSIPKSGWRGLGWFRLRLQTDPALANQPLALVMVHYGASEIYLDGKLIERFGTVGTTPETEVAYNPNTYPYGIVLEAGSSHVIAVRHSCMALRNLTTGLGHWFIRQNTNAGFRILTNNTLSAGAGFGLRLRESSQAFTEYFALHSKAGYNLWSIGLFLAIGLLHILLYWFYRPQCANLFFGLFGLGCAVNFARFYLMPLSHADVSGTIAMLMASIVPVLLPQSALLVLMYTIFSLRIPKWFWVWLLAALLNSISLFFLWQAPRPIGLFYLAVSLFPAVEVTRVLAAQWKKLLWGAKIIGVGILLFTIYQFLSFFLALLPGVNLDAVRAIITLAITLIISTYLAHQFAHTNHNLEEQLVQVKQLSAAALEHEKVKAEHDRKTKELEEARQLQLSMLPKKLPDLPHLDLAAYMQTASEVGGDYYDFHTGDDGTLTVAIGDATGHGLKAGTMVAAVKSLFVTLAYHPDIPHIFMRMSQTLKQMQMRGVFMALALVKTYERRATIAIAGMPPLLLFRSATNSVERINLTGLPLGGVISYRYREMTTDMQPGDVLLLLSDGLTELFNPADEMFGEERVEQCLQASAQMTPDEIIAQLLAAAEEWAEGRKLDDDLTLVVLKAK